MSEMISIAAYKIQGPFEAPFRAISSWLRAQKTQSVLNRLSTRELNDIGIERADIEAISRRVSR